MIKKIRKWYSFADYLDEEKFLEDQHQQGWKMIDYRTLGLSYTFEKCEAENYVYQLDYKKESQSEEDYILLFEDCGWEYFYKYNFWYYFRKNKSDVEEENVIFNDVQSRAEMAKKVLKGQWKALVPILIILPIMLNLFF